MYSVIKLKCGDTVFTVLGIGTVIAFENEYNGKMRDSLTRQRVSDRIKVAIEDTTRWSLSYVDGVRNHPYMNESDILATRDTIEYETLDKF